MPKFHQLAATVVGTGLLALGGVAASTGAANASTNVKVTSCNGNAPTPITLGVMPTCASSGTVRYPTQIKLTVNSAQLSLLINPITGGVGQGIKDHWALQCYAGGTLYINKSGTFKVTSSQTKTSTILPMGRQVPSYCKVSSTVSTLLGASTALLGNTTALGVSDNVTADTASTNYVRNLNGRDWCADSPGSSSAIGKRVQVWKCISDPAQRWTYSPIKEIIHEGRCLGYNSYGAAQLQACTGAADQIWNSNGAWRELRSNGGKCLTVSRYANGTTLRAGACRWTTAKRWAIPGRARY